MLIKICNICMNIFHSSKQFCSIQCAAKHNVRKRYSSSKSCLSIHCCPSCQQLFIGRKLTCSMKCRNIYNSKKHRSKNTTLDVNVFLHRACLIHSDRYDYSKVVYKNSKTKVEIICRDHGSFLQRPHSHWNGQGCKKCAVAELAMILTNSATFRGISNKERQWLDSLKISHRQKIIKVQNETYRVDGLSDDGKTIYEFYGDYWHGNPIKFNPEKINAQANKTFGELYYQTTYREQKLKEAGYNVISIWESDFDHLPISLPYTQQ